MMIAKFAASTLALALGAAPASAAVYSVTQPANAYGDLATDQESEQYINLPTFDPALGTLSTSIQVQGILGRVVN